MTAQSRIKDVLDEVKPLVLARDFRAVCERLESESEIAVSQQRLADAASLTSMLGSFRSMTGDDEAALIALQRAEQLEPGNPHRSLSTAEHLFARMDRKDEAACRIDDVLKRQQLDAVTRHDALALLGRMAMRDRRISEAVELLDQACKVATAAGLEAIFWDQRLARELADDRMATESVRRYASALITRAEAEADDLTKQEASKIVTSLDTQRT